MERLCGVFWSMCCSSAECIEKESLKINVSYGGVFHTVINLINPKATGNYLPSKSDQSMSR